MAVDLSALPPGSVAVVFGTRPEIIKLAGIIRILGDRCRTVYSGQHFDERLSAVFFEELGLPRCDVLLGVGGRTRGAQIGELVARLESEFASNPPLAVVVQGDTNTTLGGALAANANHLLLAHVEAGLRSFDRRMPEEHNRVVADHLADLCFAPTDVARRNLIDEAIPAERVTVTGNTVVEAALECLPDEAGRAELLRSMALSPGRFVLATFHRPENVDDRSRLVTIVEQIGDLGVPVVFPVHPRTLARLADAGLDPLPPHVRAVEPLGARAFLGLAHECALLVSDSGGVQEEASIVKRPVLVVRRSTERPEVVGTFATLVPDPAHIGASARSLLARLDEIHEELRAIPTPYGDGRSSGRCVERLAEALLA